MFKVSGELLAGTKTSSGVQVDGDAIILFRFLVEGTFGALI